MANHCRARPRTAGHHAPTVRPLVVLVACPARRCKGWIDCAVRWTPSKIKGLAHAVTQRCDRDHRRWPAARLAGRPAGHGHPHRGVVSRRRGNYANSCRCGGHGPGPSKSAVTALAAISWVQARRSSYRRHWPGFATAKVPSPHRRGRWRRAHQCPTGRSVVDHATSLSMIQTGGA